MARPRYGIGDFVRSKKHMGFKFTVVAVRAFGSIRVRSIGHFEVSAGLTVYDLVALKKDGPNPWLLVAGVEKDLRKA